MSASSLLPLFHDAVRLPPLVHRRTGFPRLCASSRRVFRAVPSRPLPSPACPVVPRAEIGVRAGGLGFSGRGAPSIAMVPSWPFALCRVPAARGSVPSCHAHAPPFVPFLPVPAPTAISCGSACRRAARASPSPTHRVQVRRSRDVLGFRFFSAPRAAGVLMGSSLRLMPPACRPVVPLHRSRWRSDSRPRRASLLVFGGRSRLSFLLRVTPAGRPRRRRFPFPFSRTREPHVTRDMAAARRCAAERGTAHRAGSWAFAHAVAVRAPVAGASSHHAGVPSCCDCPSPPALLVRRRVVRPVRHGTSRGHRPRLCCAPRCLHSGGCHAGSRMDRRCAILSLSGGARRGARR